MEELDKKIKEIVDYCHSQKCETCPYHLREFECRLHNPSCWEV